MQQVWELRNAGTVTPISDRVPRQLITGLLFMSMRLIPNVPFVRKAAQQYLGIRLVQVGKMLQSSICLLQTRGTDTSLGDRRGWWSDRGHLSQCRCILELKWVSEQLHLVLQCYSFESLFFWDCNIVTFVFEELLSKLTKQIDNSIKIILQ